MVLITSLKSLFFSARPCLRASSRSTQYTIKRASLKEFSSSRRLLDSIEAPKPYGKSPKWTDAFKEKDPKARAVMLVGFGIMCSMIAAWKIKHLYIEHYLHPTNPNLTPDVRNYLRGAYTREVMDPDPSIAEQYLSLAFRRILELKQLEPSSLEFLAIALRLAKAHENKKTFPEALDVYIEIWNTLMDSIDLSIPSQTQIGDFQERLSMLLDTGLSISAIYFQLNDNEFAKGFLSKGFQITNDALSQASQNPEWALKLEKYSIDYRVSLACTYALLKDYNRSLALYKSVLQDLVNQPPPQGCMESKVLSYIAEVTYADTKDIPQAIKWAWKAYRASEPLQESSMAGASASANALSTLGLLYEKMSDLTQARACYAKAVTLASESCDSDLTRDIGFRLGRIQDIPE